MKCHAFTLSENRIVNRLRTKIFIYNQYLNQELDNSHEFVGIWDTGATTTCITSDVASRLGIIPTGTVVASTAGGITDCNTYCVDIILPNNVIIRDLLIYEVQLNDGDALIGMDVIKYGDFSITNYDGKTKLSFRIPSLKEMDYVKELKNTPDKSNKY